LLYLEQKLCQVKVIVEKSYLTADRWMLMFLIGFEYGAFYAWECAKSVRFIWIRLLLVHSQ
tara:strand:- start:887 stop:1069 length:183 start_codon:yes stop_codon:yes gene_type:complete